jgi:hypothetical protein
MNEVRLFCIGPSFPDVLSSLCIVVVVVVVDSNCHNIFFETGMSPLPGPLPPESGGQYQYPIPRLPIDRQKYVAAAIEGVETISVLLAGSSMLTADLCRVYICPKKPRHRRKVSELSRTWLCEYPDCGRRYELAHSLSQHIKRKHPGYEQFIGNTSMSTSHVYTPCSRSFCRADAAGRPFINARAWHPSALQAWSVRPSLSSRGWGVARTTSQSKAPASRQRSQPPPPPPPRPRRRSRPRPMSGAG